MALFGWRKKPQAADNLTDVIMLQPGPYRFDIVGESTYQDQLAELVGGKTENGADHYFMALLAPEPQNPYDSNAVRIAIEARTVGYLARSHALDYRAALGLIPAVCCANVVGGWLRERTKSEGSFGVKLAISWPPKRATFG